MTFLTEHTSTIKCDSEGVLGTQRTGALKASFSVALDTCAIMTQHLAQECTNVRAIMTQHLAQGCTNKCAIMTQHLAQGCTNKCAIMTQHLAQGCKRTQQIPYYRYC